MDELIADFPGLRTGDGRSAALRLFRSPESGDWQAEVRPYYRASVRPEDLRAFALACREVLAARRGERDPELFDDGYANADAIVGFDPDDGGFYLLVWLFFDVKQDYLGTDIDGTRLYANRLGGSHVSIQGHAYDEDVLARGAESLLTRLDAGRTP